MELSNRTNSMLAYSDQRGSALIDQRPVVAESGLRGNGEWRENCLTMEPDAVLTPQFFDILEKVFNCIQALQSSGQVVALDSIAFMMERDHGVKDRDLIEAATKDLEAQRRIISAPLYWQAK
jgi:hypothetical protein